MEEESKTWVEVQHEIAMDRLVKQGQIPGYDGKSITYPIKDEGSSIVELLKPIAHITDSSEWVIAFHQQLNKNNLLKSLKEKRMSETLTAPMVAETTTKTELTADQIKGLVELTKVLKGDAKQEVLDILTANAIPVKTRKTRGPNKKKEESTGVSIIPSGVVETENEVTLNGYFKMNKGTFKVLKRNIEKGVPSLLIGQTGLGKTEVADNMAKVLGLPVTIFDMGTMTDAISSLIGTHVLSIEDGKTNSKFILSRFAEVIQKPGVVVLDEVSRNSAMSNNLLFPVLDFRKELPMEYSFEDTTSIKVHPQCVFIATANLGSQYTGTHKIDRALLDRFMVIEMDTLNSQQLKEIVKAHCPSVKASDISTIVSYYDKINKAHEDFTIGFNLSPRHLKMIASLVQDNFTIYDSFYTICKGLGGQDGLKTIKTILEPPTK